MNKMMKGILLFLAGCVLIALVSAVQPQAEQAAVGHEDYDVGVGDEEFVEDTTTTVRPARRRLPGSRAKAKNGGVGAAAAATTTSAAPSTTEKPAKRARTQPSGNSRTTTKTPLVEVTEQPVSTYRRPKFPPRRLPIPTKKPTTEVPPEELLTDDPFYADEGPVGADGQPEAPQDEELAPEGAAR